MFTICDLQLEPGRFYYITDLKFLSHASVTTLYSINLDLLVRPELVANDQGLSLIYDPSVAQLVSHQVWFMLRQQETNNAHVDVICG